MEKSHTRFVLIGHSNGGLVSRYYIENLERKGTDNVEYQSNIDKLITIDTPHYGASVLWLPYISTKLLSSGMYINNLIVPLDVELRPNSSLYTGNYLNNGSITKYNLITLCLKFISPMYNRYVTNRDTLNTYIDNNQSEQLKGQTGVDTKYYTIGGASLHNTKPYSKINPSLTYTVEVDCSSCLTQSELENTIITTLNNKYTDSNISSLGYANDNVVELSSQLGIDCIMNKHIDFEKSAVFVNTGYGNSVTEHYHSKILKEPLLSDIIFDYINN